MPNVMAALPNTSDALCSTLQCLVRPTTRVPCSAAKARNLLKVAGVPQTNEMTSAAGRPKFTVLWRHVDKILLFNKFFSDCRYVRRYNRTRLCLGVQMAIFCDFLHPLFSASCMQHVSDLHPKFH